MHFVASSLHEIQLCTASLAVLRVGGVIGKLNRWPRIDTIPAPFRFAVGPRKLLGKGCEEVMQGYCEKGTVVRDDCAYGKYLTQSDAREQGNHSPRFNRTPAGELANNHLHVVHGSSDQQQDD